MIVNAVRSEFTEKCDYYGADSTVDILGTEIRFPLHVTRAIRAARTLRWYRTVRRGHPVLTPYYSSILIARTDLPVLTSAASGSHGDDDDDDK